MSRQMIDDILAKYTRPKSPQQVNLERVKERLVPLLERYGYHLETLTMCMYEPGSDWSYLKMAEPVDCKEKPYRIWEEKGHLVIVHGECFSSAQYWCDHDHKETFLKAMIPVIGRLDAQAHFDPGENGKDGPWLRIYL